MIRITLLLAAATFASAPAMAGEKAPVFVKSEAVRDKKAITLDPASGYVMLRTDVAMPMHLMRVPSEAERATYADLRAKALQDAQRKYVRKLKIYENAVKAAAKAGPQPLPAKPVEPTEANFEFTPFELMTGVSIGPDNRFAKQSGGASTYLQALTPGEYRIYGEVQLAPGGGAFGICYCMGSVRFTVRAGEITDMGVIATKQKTPAYAVADKDFPVPMQVPNFLGPAPAEMPIDPRLAGFPVRRADYHPVGKLPNYFGVQVGRIPAMPGVLRYDRDRIVDLTAK